LAALRNLPRPRLKLLPLLRLLLLLLRLRLLLPLLRLLLLPIRLLRLPRLLLLQKRKNKILNKDLSKKETEATLSLFFVPARK
jgi:hypothetical protein